ncbi:hypothetical protein LZ30DRAFT_256709 [Colletotrichum cereale]|nr:hypothetical protein LZ30DRAFT_256709 [Colletotrichum cereale]
MSLTFSSSCCYCCFLRRFGPTSSVPSVFPRNSLSTLLRGILNDEAKMRKWGGRETRRGEREPKNPNLVPILLHDNREPRASRASSLLLSSIKQKSVALRSRAPFGFPRSKSGGRQEWTSTPLPSPSLLSHRQRTALSFSSVLSCSGRGSRRWGCLSTWHTRHGGCGYTRGVF